MPYQLKKGDLFKVKENAVLTHACNAQGVWGRGIAALFKKKYPKAFKRYNGFCYAKSEMKTQILGKALIARDTVPVGCLITSWHYSPPDPSMLITEHTEMAAESLITQVQTSLPNYEIHSCKINAGLFKVPWEESEDAIKKALAKTGDKIKWVVWEL